MILHFIVVWDWSVICDDEIYELRIGVGCICQALNVGLGQLIKWHINLRDIHSFVPRISALKRCFGVENIAMFSLHVGLTA